MADQFCSKCGSALEADVKFCKQCGAAVMGGAVIAAGNMPVDHRTAKADAKAAAARAKALRPWYKKKRFILGIPLATLIGLSMLGAALGDDASDSSTSQVASSGGSSVSSVSSSNDNGPFYIGDRASVGDLDLQLLRLDNQFDGTGYNMFNTANVAVTLSISNARGDNYNFSPVLALKLIDGQGVAHSPTVCVECPNELGSTDLVSHGNASGVVYFEIPAGRSLVELHYQAFLSTNEVTFRLTER